MSGHSVWGNRFQGRTLDDMIRAWDTGAYLSAEELCVLKRRCGVTDADIAARYAIMSGRRVEVRENGSYTIV